MREADLKRLLKDVKAFYKKEGRSHLPWRHTHDPYKILVSELMLQQTQVSRVIPYYERWIKKFPTAKTLAKAPLREVLQEWQGLGYNRRGKYLWEAAKLISKEKYTGQKLPGVGLYTRGAVLAFAYNKPEVFIETNIRTVFFYYMSGSKKVSDEQLLPLVGKALKKSKMQPRDFYAALMDYGSYLKQSGVKVNVRSSHYAKQSKFEGSARQLRGAILRELLQKSQTLGQLIKKFSPTRNRGDIERELGRLVQENLIINRHRVFEVAS